MPKLAWRGQLLDWYARHARDLPWRRTCDPYSVWVSEVMLQQTQVATVLPYYTRWMERFPTVEALAGAAEDDVLTLWQGLGYYRRARYLRMGARHVVQNGWPKTLAEWRRVPGIGPYTAAAIGSIAQNIPAAVVDGNVERVFARFTANEAVDPRLLKEAQSWADQVLDRAHPAAWNQALMELGATLCTPKNPKCERCPVAESCVARQTWTVERYPASGPKVETVRERHVVWVPYFDGEFGIVRIPAGQWWEGLWEFPRVVATKNEDADLLSETVGPGWREVLGQVRHQVTHHRITIDAFLIRCDDRRRGLEWRHYTALENIAMPSLTRKVLRLALRALGIQ